MGARAKATIDDLHRIDGKAEIVDGEIVLMSPTGAAPHDAAVEITASLKAHSRQTGRGRAVGDNAAFRVDLKHRQSFSPDAAPGSGSAHSAAAHAFVWPKTQAIRRHSVSGRSFAALPLATIAPAASHAAPSPPSHKLAN